MPSVPTDFWSGWVTVITIVTLMGLAWVVYSVYFPRDADVLDEVWDETLREGTSPAPLWWFWLILTLLGVTVVYLMLYPGLGSYRGALRWSQGGQIAASTASYDQRFGPERARIAGAAVAALQQEPGAMLSAAHVFANHCAACHGPDASGQAQLFPNLADDDWQWGGGEREIVQTITLGRQAIMPPLQAALNDDGVAQVADYVLALSRANAAAVAESEGARLFQTYCSACHGAAGAGTTALGAPALNDDLWLYGGSVEAIRASIATGRTGVMPPFGERLDATQVKLLTAWLAGGAEATQGR
jgi:cytochrome c oxidase cbb3-type subunit 3